MNTSQDLLVRLGNGERAAESAIFRRYVHRLAAMVRRRLAPQLRRRIDSDDVLQSTYRSFFLRMRRGQVVIERSGDLWRLLVAIGQNKLRSQVEHHTAQRRDFRRESDLQKTDTNGDPMPDRHTSEPTPDEAAAVAEHLQAFLAKLTPDQRTTLELRLKGETIEVIAGRLGRSHRTTRRFLQQVQQDLERELAENRESG